MHCTLTLHSKPHALYSDTALETPCTVLCKTCMGTSLSASDVTIHPTLTTSAGSHPSCFEVHIDAPEKKVPVLSFRCAAARPGKGDAVCSLVPLRHADNAINIGAGGSEVFNNNMVLYDVLAGLMKVTCTAV